MLTAQAGEDQNGTGFGLADPIGFRHQHREGNEPPCTHAQKRLEDRLDVGVLEEQFPAAKGIHAEDNRRQTDSQSRHAEASRAKGLGHLGRVLLAFEPRDKDLDAYAASHDHHGEREVDESGVARTVDLEFAGAAQEEVVREDHQELYEAAEGNGDGDAKQVSDVGAQRLMHGV